MTSDSDSCSDIPGGHPKGEDHIPATPTNGTDATRQVKSACRLHTSGACSSCN